MSETKMTSGGISGVDGVRVVLFGLFKYPFGEAASSQLRHLGMGLQAAGARVRILTLGPDLSQAEPVPAALPFDKNIVPYVSCIGERPRTSLQRVAAGILGSLRARKLLNQYARAGELGAIIVDQPTVWTYSCLLGLSSLRAAKIIARRVEWFEPEVFPLGRMDPRYLNDRIGRKWDGRLADGIISISGYIERQYPPAMPRIRVPTLFDFTRELLPSLADRPRAGACRLLYAGTMKPNDGVMDVVQALRKSRARGGAWSLTILGTRPDLPEARRLMEYCDATAELRGHMELAGRIPEGEYMGCLASATALILLREPGVRSEASFPTRLPEYLATGRPVISSAVPDIPNYLSDRVHAHLVPPSRPDLIAARLDEIQRDPLRADELGARGRARGEECFDYRQHGIRLHDFVARLLQLPARGRTLHGQGH